MASILIDKLLQTVINRKASDLHIAVGSDFADLFEVKDALAKQGSYHTRTADRELVLSYRRGTFNRATVIHASEPCEVDDGGLTFAVEIAPHGSWHTRLDVLTAIAQWGNAVSSEAQALLQYNTELANLELTPDERMRMLRDLNSILEYVDRLNELDTDGIEPMAQVSDRYGVDEGRQGSDRFLYAAREDVREGLRPSLSHETAVENAPDTDGTFFQVPKVIER